MERFKIFLLTVAVSVQVMSQDNSTEPPLQISKPKITVNLDYEVLYNTETVTLRCEVSEEPEGLQYDWYKDSVDLGQHELSITASGSGRYQCKAKKGATESEKSDSHPLTLKELPQPNLSISPQWGLFYQTEKVSLKCSVNEDSNKWDYEWFRNVDRLLKDKEKDFSFSGDTLSISSAKAAHSGEYSCRGRHQTRTPVTTRQAEAVQLQILDNTPKPDIRKSQWFEPFYTNERVQLDCQMPGTGWKYQWFNGSNSRSTNFRLSIDSLSVADTGDYRCRAQRGDFSMDSEILRLRVQKPPKLQIQSDWTEAFPGEKVSLQCVITGVSNSWTYMWFKGSDKVVSDGETIMKGDTLTLSVKSSDDGAYVCQAELQDRRVTTEKSTPRSLKVHGSEPTLILEQDPSYPEIYTGEQVKLTCRIKEPTSQWEYHWKKDSTQVKDRFYNISSAALSHGGSYTCEVRRRGTTFSKSRTLTIRARPPALLSLETELGDIMTGDMTLRCNVTDGRQWNYTWFKDGQQLNTSSDLLKVAGNEETIKNEFKCMGINTVRPLYSALSDGFIANNMLFKRKILLAISGCLVCCIVILIIGCVVLKVTRKPEVKEKTQEDLFFSMTDSKNKTTSPMKEYMDRRPSELNEYQEKEELITDRASAVHEDGVIKDEDTPASETNGLVSFKGN